MLVKKRAWNMISTHTPLARRDLLTFFIQRHDKISTHTPLARRDALISWLSPHEKFLLTRLSRGVTNANIAPMYFSKISTHTPLARRDLLLLPLSYFL